LNINPLVIEGDLTVDTNATLDADGLTLTLNGDWTNDGTYVPNSNTTIFAAPSSQTLSGTGTFDFYNLTKNESGTLNLSSSINIAGIFFLEEGSVNDGGNSIVTSGNVIIDGTHSSSGGNGIVFSGSSSQQLSRSTSGTGTLWTITINNASGVEIPDGNGYNFDINGNLRLQSGVLNIGGALVSVSSSGNIVAVSAFGIGNMVQTNSSFTDNGLRKFFPAGYGTDFTFPIGQTKYTPVIFDFSTGSNTFGTTAGSITVRPANEYHPTVDDGSDYFTSGDINNVLQYHWILNADNVSGFTSDVEFHYDQADVKSDEPGESESDYIAAQILTDNNPTNAINKFTAANAVDETNNIINFALTSVTDEGISGDYFAGIDEAIPDVVATYTSTMDGDVDAVIYDIPVPGGGAPRGAVLVVATGTTVTFNINNVNLYKTEIQAGGTLEVDETDGHRLGTVSGTGDLKLVSNTSSVVLPAGYYVDFFSCTGGGLEYGGTGNYNILGGISSIRNLTLSGSGNRNFPNNNITICEDLVIDGSTGNTYSNKRIYLNGDFTLNSGTFNLTSGSSSRLYVRGDDFTINGGTFSAGNSGAFVVFTGNTTINGGTFNLGGSSILAVIRGDFELNGGAVNSQTSNLYLNSDSYVQRIIGDFTGTNKLYNVIIDNRTGSQNYSFEGDFEVSNTLSLTDGIVNTHGNDFILEASATVSPANGKSTSFINGRMKKVMNSGATFTFPIGKGWRWGYAKVKNTSAGTYTWEAEYYNTGPINDADVTDTTPTSSTINSISGNEYWRISDGGASGVTAIIGLSWDGMSDVSATSSEREELEVMAWNSSTSTWDNFGGQNFSASHTQSAGNFESSSTVTFSERIFTLGSSDASNPLPVDLISFTAKKTEDGVRLDWETASEKNNDYFEVQRSPDGMEFTVIGEVTGAGTTNEHQFYSLIDAVPYSGINYYRLKQVDFDGAFEYSKVISVDVGDAVSNKFDFVMYPNPAKNSVVNLRFVTNDYRRPVKVTIFNTTGMSIYSNVIDLQEQTGDLRIALSRGIKSGIYVVRIAQGKRLAQGKLVILNR